MTPLTTGLQLQPDERRGSQHMLELFGRRYDQHVEIASVSELKVLWPSRTRLGLSSRTPAELRDP